MQANETAGLDWARGALAGYHRVGGWGVQVLLLGWRKLVLPSQMPSMRAEVSLTPVSFPQL